MFSTIKMYLAAGLAFAVAIAIAVFKARGAKIDELEKDIEVKDKEAKVTAAVVENEKQAAAFVADNRVAKVIAEVPVEDTDSEYDPNDKFYI